METAFTRLVGCRVPVQQAPMGSVSTPDLAVAVATAGGLGTITALGMPAAAVERTLTDMCARTDGALAVNFLTADIDRDALAVAAERVRVVDFFWTDPDRSLVELAHAGGALAVWQVGSTDEARAAVDAGCDAIAVQGIEAGGHVRGYRPLRELLDDVLAQVAVPVLAAGGIATADDVAAVLAAGAAGVRMGTRFLATVESGAHDEYKRAVVAAGSGSTEVTDAFAVCPLCATSPRARVLSACVEHVHALADETVGTGMIGGQTISLPRGSGMPPSTTATGRIDAMAMYAGESVARIDRVMAVAELIEELTAAR